MSAQPRSFEDKWLDRPMLEADIDRILEIERRAYQFPWGAGVFRDCLRMHYITCVAEDVRQQIHGYALMSHGAGEAHILNLCVDVARQRCGLGRFLLHRLIEQAQKKKLSTVYLEVRPSNEAALALYDSEGFNEIGQRRDYYPAAKGREDAILLARILF